MQECPIPGNCLRAVSHCGTRSKAKYRQAEFEAESTTSVPERLMTGEGVVILFALGRLLLARSKDLASNANSPGAEKCHFANLLVNIEDNGCIPAECC
jgi:hypothetical protein